jgi:hypothetical protein
MAQGCYLLFAVSFLLFLACFFLSAICHLLSAVSFLLFLVRFFLSAICSLL